MKYCLFVFLSLFQSLSIYSQVKGTDQETAKKIKEREMLVILEQETYPAVKQANTYLKDAIKSFWDFNENYRFIYRDQLESLDQSKYSFIGFTKFRVERATLLGGIPVNTELNISADLLDSFRPKHPVCSINLVHQIAGSADSEDYDLVAHEKDIIFGIQMLNAGLWNSYEGHGQFYNPLKNRSITLADRTLLIDQDLLTDSFKKAAVEKAYPYQFEIASYEQIAEKIKQKDDQYAYLGIMRGILSATGVTSAFLISVIDATTGEYISSCLRPMRVDYEMDAKHIKSLLKYDEKYK